MAKRPPHQTEKPLFRVRRQSIGLALCTTEPGPITQCDGWPNERLNELPDQKLPSPRRKWKEVELWPHTHTQEHTCLTVTGDLNQSKWANVGLNRTCLVERWNRIAWRWSSSGAHTGRNREMVRSLKTNGKNEKIHLECAYPSFLYNILRCQRDQISNFEIYLQHMEYVIYFIKGFRKQW